MIKAAYQMVGHNFNNDRIENDFYATPLDAIEDLIKYEKFDGKIWECSCGDGAISDPLIKAGYDVYSSDLIDRGYGEVKDFLTTNDKVDNIITNPPFETKIKQKILKKLVEIDKPFIIILNCMNIYSKYFRDIFEDNIKYLQIIIPKGKIKFEKYNEEKKCLEKCKTDPAFYCCYLTYKMNIPNEDLWLK